MQTEILSVLIAHAKKYPLMLPCDAVKLLYQNEFGGGHLVQDEKLSLARIKEEYMSVSCLSAEMHPVDIGNHLVRFPLAALHKNKISPEELNRIFVLSSKIHCGNLSSFKEKTNVLLKGYAQIPFSFSKEDLMVFLAQYNKDGYPMLSHSSQYRNAYKPSYRIVRNAFLENVLL